MAIKATDLRWYSLNMDGGLSSRIAPATLHNVFGPITGAQNRDGITQYKIIAVVNEHASLPLTAARIYFRTVQSGGANIAMALDTLGPANKTGVVWTVGGTPTTFVSPVTFGTGLLVSTLNPGFAVAIWLRRSISSAAALRPEKTTLTIAGTTAA